MSDLTNGFSDAQLNDHSASDSIERVLDEASVEGALKECLLDAFKAEVGKNDLAQFEDILRASLIAGGTPEDQIAHFIQYYPYGCRLFKRGDEFPDKLKDVMHNGSDEALKQLYRVILPTPLGLALKTHIFPSKPMKFLRFCIEVGGLTPSQYATALKLYGDSPFEMLVCEWLALEEADRENLPELAPVKRLEDGLGFQAVEMATLEEFTELLIRMAFYHQQLIFAGEFTYARKIETRTIGLSDPQIKSRTIALADTEDRARIVDFCDAKRNHYDLMRWHRLSATKAKSVEDSQEFLQLGFDLEKSFLDAELPADLLDVYIEASLLVVQAVARDDNGLNSLLRRHRLTGQLHKLWCYSPHKTAWLAALELQFGEIEDKPKLLLIGYLLRGTGEVSINPKSFMGAYIRLDFEELRQFDTVFNIPVESKWLSELQKLQCAFLERKLHLEVAEVAYLLDLLGMHFDNLAVTLKVADRLLAQIWLFPDSVPTLADISSSYQAQCLLMTHEPEKILRILIQAFRKSQKPCSGEKLEYGAGNDLLHVDKSENPAHWFLSIMLSNCLRLPYVWKQRQTYPEHFQKLSDEEIEELTFSLRKTLAEYCWKSLRLRKGETCNCESYEESQCTEPNRIWRETYAKALSAIGLDLGGSVHKTLNFIRKKDPSGSVKAAAASAYQSVRRKGNANGSDSIKGLLIAFWWLRLGQRTAMGLNVDPSSATRIRRDELRYADRVDSVINMIIT